MEPNVVYYLPIVDSSQLPTFTVTVVEDGLLSTKVICADVFSLLTVYVDLPNIMLITVGQNIDVQ